MFDQPMVLSDNNNGATAKSDRTDHLPNPYDLHHPRSSKRPCRNQRQQQAAGIRDCYEEATTATPRIRHDWFFEIPRISKHKHNPRYHLGPGPELAAYLTSLDVQLQQVKGRFRPASERCAQAVAHSNARIEFEQARRACNPYEPLGDGRPGGLNNGLFLNRSAVKLANMDAALKFSLTTNSNSNGSTFYFADLCAAPGGFSEYLLRRCGHDILQGNSPVACRGYGMSLVGDNAQGQGTPWKLTPGPQLLGSGRPGVFYQICPGHDGTGDILNWQNVQSLQQKIAVAQGALKPQVALVCADGGVDAQRDIQHPEEETQKLVVCQVAAAMSMLQPNGRFILKLLGCQTTLVLQRVMQELYDSFDTLQVLKPISSRPASAERYLVCSGFRPAPELVWGPASWGPAWIDRIMTGADNQPVAPELLAFLGQVDRDMMQLNLRACFAILSHLESKTSRLATPAPTDMTASIMMGDDEDGQMEEDKEEDDAWIAQGYHNFHSQDGKKRRIKKVNVNAYKGAWKLF